MEKCRKRCSLGKDGRHYKAKKEQRRSSTQLSSQYPLYEPTKVTNQIESLEYEDPYGDDFEKTDESIGDSSSKEDNPEQIPAKQQLHTIQGHEKNVQSVVPRPWKLGVDPINKDEELQCDLSAYRMLHRATIDWSCYAFSIYPDKMGQPRYHFPHVAYVIAGTQAPDEDLNRLYAMKLQNLTETIRSSSVSNDNDDNETEDSESNDVDDEPVLNFHYFRHPGSVNRTSVCPQIPRLVASWSSNSIVYIWDMKNHVDRLDNFAVQANNELQPKFLFEGHAKEGYALNFSSYKPGYLASGSCDSTLRVWIPVEGGWKIESPIRSHQASVEDVQWKKSLEVHILASCSVDGSIHIFDIRSHISTKPTLRIDHAHECDVNCISWNPTQENLIVSGGDDGATRLWDIRNVGLPVLDLHWHKKPVTSVDWHPTEEDIFAAACDDNSITIWDISIEKSSKEDYFPDQLIFQHMGQTHISLLQWHPQIPGMIISTAEDGLNIFKTCNI